MKGGMRVALAVAAGYFLGRTRKMKAALMLAGAGATGRLPNNSRELVREGVKRLGDSGEVSKLVESVRGELTDAAKNAAIAAASNRIDALTNRIEGTTEDLAKGTTEGLTKTTEGVAKGAEDLTKGLTGVLAPEEEHEDTEEPGPDESSTREKETAGVQEGKDTTEHADAPRRRSTSPRTRSTASRSGTPRTRKTAQPKAAQPKSAQSKPRTTARSVAPDDAPVRRTGR